MLCVSFLFLFSDFFGHPHLPTLRCVLTLCKTNVSNCWRKKHSPIQIYNIWLFMQDFVDFTPSAAAEPSNLIPLREYVPYATNSIYVGSLRWLRFVSKSIITMNDKTCGLFKLSSIFIYDFSWNGKKSFWPFLSNRSKYPFNTFWPQFYLLIVRT